MTVKLDRKAYDRPQWRFSTQEEMLEIPTELHQQKNIHWYQAHRPTEIPLPLIGQKSLLMDNFYRWSKVAVDADTESRYPATIE